MASCRAGRRRRASIDRQLRNDDQGKAAWQLAARESIAPDERDDTEDAEHDVRATSARGARARSSPNRAGGRFRSRVVPLGLRLGQVHDDVVGEDDGDADDEAAHLAVPCDRQAERQADHRENEARDRDRELLLDLDDLGVRRKLRVAGQLHLHVLRSSAIVFSVRPRGSSAF